MEQRVICERGADSLGEIPAAGRTDTAWVTAAPVITEGDVSGLRGVCQRLGTRRQARCCSGLCQSAAQFLARCAAV